jgi:folate-dependent phosphoribosylglycinamide formyltransferase PurN
LPATAKNKPKVAGFMSGSGSNLRRLLEFPNPAFEVVFLFSDNAGSQIKTLATDYNLPYCVYDIRRFYQQQRLPRRLDSPRSWEARRCYDQTAARLLRAFNVDIIALGGYMSFLTLEQGGVNVHPGDLSLKDSQGRRLLAGDRAVELAIRQGCRWLRASTIWIDSGVDSGPLLLRSAPLAVNLSCPLAELVADPTRLRQEAARLQELLKQKGDWHIFPLTIQLLAQGRLRVAEGIAWLDGRPFPEGIAVDAINVI